MMIQVNIEHTTIDAGELSHPLLSFGFLDATPTARCVACHGVRKGAFSVLLDTQPRPRLMAAPMSSSSTPPSRSLDRGRTTLSTSGDS